MHSKGKNRVERLAALGVKSEITTPPGETQMSAVILQLVDPLLKQHGKTPERAKAILSLAIAGWNKSVFPLDQQPAIENELIDSLVPKDGSAEEVGVVAHIMDLLRSGGQNFSRIFASSSWTTKLPLWTVASR